MKVYQCHKQVEAAEIIRVDGLKLLLADGHTEDGATKAVPYPVTREFIEKHNPQSGDYLVRYADGYLSVSPAQAFLEGYAEIERPAPAEAEPAQDAPAA